MSSLWTPAGEHRLDPPSTAPSSAPADQAGHAGEHPGSGAPSDAPADQAGHAPPLDPTELARIQQELAATPPEVLIANHCYGLFELASVYLAAGSPPMLDRARLAIDALGSLVEGLSGRLGDQEATLRDALARIRVAYVGARSAGGGEDAPGDGATTST